MHTNLSTSSTLSDRYLKLHIRTTTKKGKREEKVEDYLKE